MLEKQLLQTIEEYRMFSPGDTLIVGVSGGADSVALLHLLAGIGAYRVVVAHVNHQLRGSESDEDEAFVRDLADSLSCVFELHRTDVERYAAEHRTSLEDAGRQVRYGFFQELRERYSAAVVVVAHTADDQAETFMMRLLRGACGTGLRGILPVNDTGIVRPLLAVSRDDIERYLVGKGVLWRTDSSNADVSFLRNRIRRELLPLLQQYNPAVHDVLATTARVLASDEQLLDSLSAEEFIACAAIAEGKVTFSVTELAGKPEALRLRLIRKAIGAVKGNLQGLAAVHIFSVEALLFSDKPNAEVSLPGGCSARRAYEHLMISQQTDSMEPFEIVIDSPGEYRLPTGTLLIVTRACREDMQAPRQSDRILVDGQAAPFPWVARSFRDGDRVQLPGMEGRKKIKKLFMEQKVPVVERSRVPLLFCGDDLLWVCGIRRSVLAQPRGDIGGAYMIEYKL